MNWEVSSRNQTTGAIETLYIEAENREELFAELQTRGINAMRVQPATGKKPKKPSAKKPKTNASKKSNGGKIVLSVLIILAIAGGAFYFLSSSKKTDEKNVEEKSAPVAIEEVTPAPATPVAEPEKVEEKKPTVKWRGKEYPMYDEKGGRAIVTGYGVKYLTPVVITNSSRAAAARETIEYKSFNNYSDRQIAMLLNTEPGTQLIGDGGFGNGRNAFTKSFLKSINTPITIEPTDSEEVRALKEAVRDARNELKERYEQGEDVEKIMADTRKELQELGLYREEIKKLMRENYRKVKSEAEAQDLLNAANAMLEERGAKPVELPKFWKRKFELQAIRDKKKQAQ